MSRTIAANLEEVLENLRDPYLIDRPDYDSLFRAVLTLDAQVKSRDADLVTARAEIARLDQVVGEYHEARKWEAVALQTKNERLERYERELDELRDQLDATRICN